MDNLSFTGNDFSFGSGTRFFAVCLSGTTDSEAYWKVYAPREDGIRLTFDTRKLVTHFQTYRQPEVRWVDHSESSNSGFHNDSPGSTIARMCASVPWRDVST